MALLCYLMFIRKLLIENYMLDTIRTVETPEGVELELSCASFFVRSMAWLLDLLIQGAFFIALAIALPALGKFGWGVMFIVLFFMHWLYPVFFEIYMNGQTPGKKYMQLQVLLLDGTPVTWEASLLRNLLRTVDFLPSMYALGVLSMLLSKDFRRLGDLAANTIVVYKRQMKARPELLSSHAHAPDVVLSLEEQQILVSFAERVADLSTERAEELALLARPLLSDLNETPPTVSVANNKPLQPASQRLLAIANYLVGQR